MRAANMVLKPGGLIIIVLFSAWLLMSLTKTGFILAVNQDLICPVIVGPRPFMKLGNLELYMLEKSMSTPSNIVPDM